MFHRIPIKSKLTVFFLIVTMIFFLLQSCGKKWKKTTNVAFKFEINKQSNGYLKFNDGYIYIKEIKFSGDRKQGEDVYFNRDFGNESKANFITSSTFVDFDIPQGTYTDIEIEIEACEHSGEEVLELTGTYINDYGDTFLVEFIFDLKIIFQIKAESADGNNEIVLIEDKPAVATTIFDPLFWFGTVTKTMLDSADVEDDDGIPTIEISDSDNEYIYILVLGKIDKGNRMVFQ